MSKKPKILVVDDEHGIREGCKRVLKPAQYDVLAAEDFQEGKRKINENKFDIVLLDIMMPGGRGIDLLSDIYEKDPDTVAIIITGYATIELAVEAIKAGAYDFISKPFTSDILLMTVQQGLEKRKLALEAKQLVAIEEEVAQLARKNEELVRLDRFKSKFVWMVAHELKSPSGGAQSLLRTLISGHAGNINDKQMDILGRIETRLSQQHILIQDLLDLAAAKSHEKKVSLELVSVCPVIKDVVQEYQVDADAKDIKLICEDETKDSTISATINGLKKIFRNLIGNAIKYTPAGGDVQVVIAKSKLEVKIDIIDSGIGIPEAVIANLGDEFLRAPNARQAEIPGSGLGISIAKQYIQQFGAQLNIESREGEGSKFSIRFPLKI